MPGPYISKSQRQKRERYWKEGRLARNKERIRLRLQRQQTRLEMRRERRAQRVEIRGRP